jgi:hypothetical protein
MVYEEHDAHGAKRAAGHVASHSKNLKKSRKARFAGSTLRKSSTRFIFQGAGKLVVRVGMCDLRKPSTPLKQQIEYSMVRVLDLLFQGEVG